MYSSFFETRDPEDFLYLIKLAVYTLKIYYNAKQ